MKKTRKSKKKNIILLTVLSSGFVSGLASGTSLLTGGDNLGLVFLITSSLFLTGILKTIIESKDDEE